MEEYLKDTVKGFGERSKRLAIFGPLFQLKSKRKTTAIPFELDWFNLGLLSLLYFFECKLHRQGKKGLQELADFLYELTGNTTGAGKEHYSLIAQTIVETFRDPSGRRHTESIFNWETGEEETYQFTILKTDSFDQETNRQYFTLDEAGLDLIFATKEYFSEFRISIAQLLIRKQLEKGEFASALHEIHEMRIAVQTLRDNIQRLGLEIARNIISEEVHAKYTRTVKAIYERLEREDEEFSELYEFVRETNQKAQIGSRHDADEEARIKIAQVDRELREVHHLHQSLLHDTLVLKNKALEAARQALFSAGVKGFNFDQEIVARVVSSPLPVEAVKALVHPFASLHREAVWPLLAIFFPQRLQKQEQEEVSFAYPEWDTQRQLQLSIQEENFRIIMELVLQVMSGQDSVELKAILPVMPAEILAHRSFCDFWLLLHQRSPVRSLKGEERHVLDKALALLDGDIVEVTETSEILSVGERYALQNMQLRRRRYEDAV
ncbi:hypothetical protein [Sporomusa malonica]|uniref:Replicative DNA helicase n=1 Tax=Sporomusa malonica TaxID=112901 RepID=A0A1W1YBB8_9FIRM|nr:hypothetical protein [Sporomusa malonica]SMC33455.1 hypothetical protein SAMN04488500_101215 [Sporomusa malonica]